MNYEQKYKEALARAKKWCFAPNSDKIPTYANRVIEEIFPELKDVEFEQEPTSNHWQDVRERAAIAAMQGVMNIFGSLDYDRETIAELAVKQADALVKKLKGE